MQYLILFLSLVLIAFFYINFAKKVGLNASPNNRGLHESPIIIGGGILYCISILIYYLSYGFSSPYFAIAFFGLAIVSFIDDIKEVSIKLRLIFQVIAVILIFFQINDPIFFKLYCTLLLIIFGVGFINSFNFMDGINGMLGVYSLLSIISFFYLNRNESLINEDFLIYITISLIVFIFFNVRKKVVMFAGDVGSVSLGVLNLFLFLSFYKILKAPILLLMFSVFGTDTFITILRRVFFKENVLTPHKKHLYQKLVSIKGMSHIKVTMTYVFIQLFINILVFITYKYSVTTQCFTFFIVVTTLFFTHFYINKRLDREKVLM